MQTYLVSYLLRTNVGRVGLLFSLIFWTFAVHAEDALPESSIERDSLYTAWSKTRSTLPTLLYRLNDFDDFNDRVEAESLSRTYGIGGVVIKNGNKQEVERWITANKSQRPQPILHVLEITRIFELPFGGLHSYPLQMEVECLTNDQWVYKLGLAHAHLLRQMGIGLVEFSDLPMHYTTHEEQKVLSYLEGLTAGKVGYFMTGKSLKAPVYQQVEKLSHSSLIDVLQITEHGLLEKKTIKNYKKRSGDDRIIIDSARDAETTIDQMERGVGLILMDRESKPQQLINSLLLRRVPNDRCFKREVKEYFGLVNQVEQRLSLPADPLTEWNDEAGQVSLASVTLIQDQRGQVPAQDLSKIQFFTVSKDSLRFESTVDKYKRATHWSLSQFERSEDSLLRLLPPEAMLLVDLTSANEGDLSDLIAKCKVIDEQIPVVVFYAGDQEVLADFEGQVSLIWAPKLEAQISGMMVEMFFGAREIKGALPGYMTPDGQRKGIHREAVGRLTYTGEKYYDQEALNKIDSLVYGAIREGMMPGCQIVMVKDGRVVYDKNFGYLTYDSLTAVRWDHMYDIASVTKTVATVPAVMESMKQGSISLSGELGDYLTDYGVTDKAHLTISDILTHQSGLKSYIPFWRYAKYDPDSASFLYKQRKWRRKYNYLSVSWPDSIQSWIAQSKYNSLSNEDGTYRYLYSDLGFMVMRDVVESTCTCSFDQSLDDMIYRPMGMDFTTFNPLTKFQQLEIAPTEQDKYFRTGLLRGVVHDKNAALLDGISGHAGLFSNANDLAKYMQMMLQGGYYGGLRYFSADLIDKFTTREDPDDRRALGWDKPDRSVGNASRYASDESFGHSGFTGTLVWADPKYDLIYIFLSNRIYPDPQNYKLIKSNTRTKIHDMMYESFLKFNEEKNQDI